MATKAQTIIETNEGRGCLGKARPDEPVFILRAQDTFAPGLVEEWASRVARSLGDTTEKVRKARALAHEMRAWQELNDKKIPD